MTSDKIIVSKKQNANDNSTIQKRRFPRRSLDVCMINVDGRPYPVVDWSQSGVLFESDTRSFVEGQTVNMILRFKTVEGVEDIKISGEVVRKNAHTVATQFIDATDTIIESFEKVISQSRRA